MFTLPWIIIYVIVGIALLMHLLSWTSVPDWLTRRFLVFTSDKKRSGLNGSTAGYWIRLYPYGDQYPKATLEHEMVHIYQNWRYTWLVVALLRAVSKNMVFRFEAQGYAAGYQHGRPLDDCARYLVNDYDLDVTLDEARQKIKSFL